MKLIYNSRIHMTYMGDTHEVLGSGEQRTQHSRPLQDLLGIRPLLSRARDVANFLNT